MQTIERNHLYTVPEVGTITGAGYYNVRRWVQRGYLKATRIGLYHVVSGNDLLATLQRWQRGEIDLDMPRHGGIKVPVLV